MKRKAKKRNRSVTASEFKRDEVSWAVRTGRMVAKLAKPKSKEHYKLMWLMTLTGVA